MTQPTLDQMNALLQGTCTADERRSLVEAILANPADAKAFRALHSLQASFPAQTQTRRDNRILASMPKLRYVLGVAAIMLMALVPYVFRQPVAPAADVNIQLIASQSTTLGSNFEIKAQVKRVNLIQKSKKWGSGVDTRHLIDLTNQ